MTKFLSALAPVSGNRRISWTRFVVEVSTSALPVIVLAWLAIYGAR